VNDQSPFPPDHAPLTQDDVGGVHVKYLHHCHRQLWLYTRGYRPEAGSDLVAFGEAIDATTFGRKRGVALDALRIDWVDGRLWVHEVKSARRPDDAHTAQARLYCLALADRGVAVQGATVHYPLARRTVTVLFDEAARASAVADRAHVVKVSAAPSVPARLERARCRGCSYLDYCWG
jgi:CRISPR-associated exonuclease Cas4